MCTCQPVPTYEKKNVHRLAVTFGPPRLVFVDHAKKGRKLHLREWIQTSGLSGEREVSVFFGGLRLRRERPLSFVAKFCDTRDEGESSAASSRRSTFVPDLIAAERWAYRTDVHHRLRAKIRAAPRMHEVMELDKPLQEKTCIPVQRTDC